LDIEYVGGIAKPSFAKKDLNRKMERFLETQPLIHTKNMIIDVPNMFLRTFMCEKSNCDFHVKYEGENKKMLFNVPDRIVSCDRGCCEGGSLEIPDELIENIDGVIEDVYEYMSPDCVNFIKTKGWKKKISKRLTGISSFPRDNRCVFTIVEDGMNYCALHRYAIMNDKDVFDYKPFECAMFPMDVLKVDGKFLFTCISEKGETYGILRWGDNHCIQSCLRKKNNGIPFYQYSKDIIVRTAGQKRYDLIDKIYSTMKWKKLLKESGYYGSI
jgi:hypothetical protein